MTDPRLVVLISVSVALAGCHSYRPTTSVPAPGGSLRVLYTTPTDVRAVGVGGDIFALARVQLLEGSVVSVHGDTIALTVTRARPGYSLPRPPAAPTVTVVRRPGVMLEALQPDPARTVGVALVVSAATLLALFIVYAVGMAGAYS